MSSEFTGIAVLAAGGTGGLGRAISLVFLERGAQVAVTFRHENELQTLKDAASNLSSSLSGFNVDVTDTRQTADLIGTGVRANSVLPSIIDTEANRKAMPNADFAKWPKPEDIAEAVLFLSCDRSRVIHSASIPVFATPEFVQVAPRIELQRPPLCSPAQLLKTERPEDRLLA